MGDDHAVVVFLVEELVDALGELQPHLVVHILRTDVHQLFATDVGQVEHLRHGIDQGLYTHLACTIGRAGG